MKIKFILLTIAASAVTFVSIVTSRQPSFAGNNKELTLAAMTWHCCNSMLVRIMLSPL
ncbi:MAG: hypothetical protein F6K54_28235 [Okeania sp. SIO3B5]|uniref:hypothetical protein n=1 Tax=Okeania sp. SIO3B5 TaxID=2607811 RepID=UPI00140058F1|nr:hypothetical protein [Okeania sp. SIO3B5]NEO56622.1 hypothetical protein [Okeania sp. SIO3B5]